MTGIQTIRKLLGIKRGSHELPRFIYHLTSKANYDAIVSTGYIRPANDTLFKGQGIFAVDLANLFKRWGRNPAWDNDSLREQLLNRVAKETDDIVILRIPTAKLDKEAIRLRNQNKFFFLTYSGSFKKVIDEAVAAVNKRVSILNDEEKWDRLFSDFLREHIPAELHELITGLPAKSRNLLKQKKAAYEYIYQNQIPVDCFEKIGEVNLATVKKSANFDDKNPIRSIFSALLKDTPEQKATAMIRE